MSENDDWFEQALSEADPDTDSEESDDGTATEATESSENPWGEPEPDEQDGGPWDEDETDDGGPWNESADADTSTGASPFDSDGSFGDSEDGADTQSPFDDADGPFDGDDDSFGDEGGEPFDGGGGDDPFDGGDGEGLFDDEGFGGLGGGNSEFEEEDFDSEIPRIDLGIEGLDNMIQGGIPERHLMVTFGSAGTGKTTFGLQFLHHGLVNGENAVFITLEQTREAIIATANEFGWDFATFEEEGQLAVVDLDPVEMANSLDNIQAELPQLIRDFGADRLVLDSVSLLEMMYDNQAKRRTEVFDFTRSLKKAGVTTFLTSEASETNPYASRHGIIEYLTDAVFVLQYVRGETQETRLAVEIQKIRNANHSREKKPYEMSEGGLSVYQQANIF